ncbi:MAG: hypothetical protein JJU05_14855 [Verrucomicrobia bacterium]|nr:hypothetical protein [Verrucomicrobiota bacterium]MCH8527867.1 hypothetical protein [Kiritimatiellia bacterium]
MVTLQAEIHPRDRVQTDNGLIRVLPPGVPEALRNPPLPEAEEAAYWERANHVIRHFEGQIGVNTTQEREKDTFPRTMYNYLLGSHDAVIEALQTPDRQGGTDHRWTKGIDYYWSFTLKGQMRKYFFFGPALDPEYRQTMFDGAKRWTAEDPRPSFELVRSLTGGDPVVRETALRMLEQFRENIAQLPDDAIDGVVRDEFDGEDLGDDPEKWTAWWRQYSDQGWQIYEDLERLANPHPHPLHGVGTGPVGGRWDPEVRGTRADARNTDNLRAMRDISVYLMAEETGNDTVRRLYKNKLKNFVVALYRNHHGEWDSENYLHHTMAPFHNLYDFARDEEVVALAKAALDYLYTSAAIKYYRGEAVAPTKRTGGGLNSYVWLRFGDRPDPVSRPYYDLFHPITSGYRPPLATLRIGQGRFPRPAEMINTKPTYSFWLPGQGDRPETWETVFYGKSYYMGSAVSRSPQGDVRAFDLAMDRSGGGARLFQANSGNRINGLRPGDQIGQFRNALIWLRRDDRADFIFNVPGEVKVETESGIWFLEHDKTYLAIHPLNLPGDAVRPVREASGGTVTVRTRQNEGAYAGFALLAADAEDFKDAAAFREAVLASAEFDLSGLKEGRVRLQAVEGHTLTLQWQSDDNRPHIERDGEHCDWDTHFDLFRPMDDNAPVSAAWEDGTLTIDAGDAFFRQTVDPSGNVTFTHER